MIITMTKIMINLDISKLVEKILINFSLPAIHWVIHK
nr:MAG TPA_asm: hypothetical protein [Caudoviricetes sp.]DAV04283.1 MAG TPA: hypothetical protein [Caudoviricetes sp.]